MRAGIALVLILASIALLTLTPGDGPILGIDREIVAGVVIAVASLMLIGGWTFWAWRGRLPEALQAIAFWLLLTVALVAGYTYRFELQAFGARVLGSLVPGLAIDGPGGTVVITRAGDGTFPVAGRVNGVAARFLFDTGASSVVIRQEDAAAFGVNPATLQYTVAVSTANGRTEAAPVTLGSVSVGAIVLRNVRALVTRPGASAHNLLGHTFLSRLSAYGVSGDRLTLSGPAR